MELTLDISVLESPPIIQYLTLFCRQYIVMDDNTLLKSW